MGLKNAGDNPRFFCLVTPCYNRFVTLKDDLIAYHTRWIDVEAVVAAERRAASLELRWRQLNAAYAMAIGLGLRREDPSENEVMERWAKLKEKWTGSLLQGK